MCTASAQSLLVEATKRGLRSRGGPNTPSKELSLSQMHRILSSPYYKGLVPYNGVLYQGKHEKLVDDETWQRVQDMLTSKANGQKQRQHHHYLKGTIACGHCGSRLCVSYSKGRGGIVYPYYFCVGRQQKRTTCMLKYRPIEAIEEEIVEHYREIQLRAEGFAATAKEVLLETSAQRSALIAERARQGTRVRQLENERTKLLHAHYAGAVPLDLLQTEQERISKELTTLEASTETTAVTLKSIEETVAKAVAWLEDCHGAYKESKPQGRKLMNQAFFKKVWVTENGVVGWEYNEPFKTLMTRHDKKPQLLHETKLAELLENETNRRDSQNFDIIEPQYERCRGYVATAFTSVGSKQIYLAERLRQLSNPPETFERRAGQKPAGPKRSRRS